MSKGYADYLIAMAREIDRDIYREQDGVEVPYLAEAFGVWLMNSEASNLKESSVKQYLQWLKKADELICFGEDWDFYALLKKAMEANDYDKAKKLCEKYDKLLTKEMSEIDSMKCGISGDDVRNCRSAFRKYCDFITETIELLKYSRARGL